jgi:hypothetical protein
MIRYRNQFTVNCEIYHIDTRQYACFHKLSVNLTKYQKGVYYLGIKVFNVRPCYINIQSDDLKIFKLILQKFLYENSFHFVNEYFELKKN